MYSSGATFKRFLYNGFCIMGGRLFVKTFFSGVGTILLFHRVCPTTKTERVAGCSGLEVTPLYLEQVISFFLERDCDFISLNELVVRLQGNHFDKKFVVITFDDGYLDNFTCAYPIFKKYNVPFAIYITTGFIDRISIMWWHLLEDLLLNNDHIHFEIGGSRFDFQCDTLVKKEKVFLEISLLITGKNEIEYLDVIKRVFTNYPIDIYSWSNNLCLNWDQIRQLYNDPLVTIGTHTVNHYALNKVSSKVLEREIIESKKRMESQLGGEIRHFSYPHGDKGEVEKREFKALEASSFVTATTTRMGNIFPAHKNHLQCLPRITMGMGLDSKRLEMVIDGVTPLVRNRFKRIITD